MSTPGPVQARTAVVGAFVTDAPLDHARAAAHRRLAFAACDALVDRIKTEVPIWKEQSFADGSTEWVGLDA
ncbi:hypothetical protein RF638_15225 [Kocuria sp. CPCC 205235]|uniref:hypothetical protein n=1 Tax=Kocuria sp. CPCC 205235 TaxID=3073549 RepID=UPI0034D73229